MSWTSPFAEAASPGTWDNLVYKVGLALEQFYASDNAIAAAVHDLPPEFSEHAKLLRGWSQGTTSKDLVFLHTEKSPEAMRKIWEIVKKLTAEGQPHAAQIKAAYERHAQTAVDALDERIAERVASYKDEIALRYAYRGPVTPAL